MSALQADIVLRQGAFTLNAVLIGNVSHSRTELIALRTVNNDASVVLAREMVAAQLNLIASGQSDARVNATLVQAQAFMTAHANASGHLPFAISMSSSAGMQASDGRCTTVPTVSESSG